MLDFIHHSRNEAPKTHSATGRDPKVSGMSILEVMISVALVGIAIAALTVYMQTSQRDAQMLAMARSGQDVAAALSSSLVGAVRASGGCVSPQTLGTLTVGAFGTAKVSTNLNLAPSIGANGVWAAASQRCQNPRTQAGGQTKGAYFCLQFTPNGTPAPGSFLASSAAFAEVFTDVEDMVKGGQVGCTQFAPSNATASRVVYTMYWANVTPNGPPILKQQTYSTLVAP